MPEIEISTEPQFDVAVEAIRQSSMEKIRNFTLALLSSLIGGRQKLKTRALRSVVCDIEMKPC